MNRDDMILKNRALPFGVLKDLGFMGCSYFEDLYSAGLEGLIIAADAYNSTKGASFSTYAYSVIKNYILREIQCLKETGYLSYRLREYKPLIMSAVAEQERKSIPKLLDFLKVRFPKLSREDISLVLKTAQPVVRLDKALDTDYDKEEVVPDQSVNIEEEVLDKIEHETLRQFISDNLPSRESEILFRYYGINGKPETLEDLGQALSLSKERVRQLRNSALQKLRNLLAA